MFITLTSEMSAEVFRGLKNAVELCYLDYVKVHIGELPTIDYQDSDTNNMSLLHIAIFERSTVIITWLLSQKASHTLKDGLGYTAGDYYMHRPGRAVVRSRSIESILKKYQVLHSNNLE